MITFQTKRQHAKLKYILQVEPEPMTKIFYLDAVSGKATLGRAI